MDPYLILFILGATLCVIALVFVLPIQLQIMLKHKALGSLFQNLAPHQIKRLKLSAYLFAFGVFALILGAILQMNSPV